MPARFGHSGQREPPCKLSFVTVAVWWLVFSIPLFRRVPEPAARLGADETTHGPVRAASCASGRRFTSLRGYRQAFLMLVAFLLYNDGIETIIRMAAIYGAEIGIDQTSQIEAFVVVQFVGIPFSFLFGALAGRIGAKAGDFPRARRVHGDQRARLFHDQRVAVLRTRVSRRHRPGRQPGAEPLAVCPHDPEHQSSEYFGFFSVFEKFAGIAGPALFAASVTLFQSAPDRDLRRPVDRPSHRHHRREQGRHRLRLQEQRPRADARRNHHADHEGAAVGLDHQGRDDVRQQRSTSSSASPAPALERRDSTGAGAVASDGEAVYVPQTASPWSLRPRRPAAQQDRQQEDGGAAGRHADVEEGRRPDHERRSGHGPGHRLHAGRHEHGSRLPPARRPRRLVRGDLRRPSSSCAKATRKRMRGCAPWPRRCPPTGWSRFRRPRPTATARRSASGTSGSSIRRRNRSPRRSG